MANKSVFAALKGRLLPQATARNAEGAPAYALAAPHALAQLAMTGTLADGFYQNGATEAARLVALAQEVEPAFLARAAIYAHERGHMKDAPALLLAVLAGRDPALFARAFPRVITSGRMLRSFVQIVRSGETGRRSLGTRPKLMVQGWLNAASDRALLQASVGQAPSLADVIRMVHPRPETPERAALYAWLIGKPADAAALPEPLRELFALREGLSAKVPELPFQMLVNLPLSAAQWAEVARRASWQVLRQGLNMFARKGVLDEPGMADHLAAVLADPARVRAARAMPYQMLATLRALPVEFPPVLRAAVERAMELSVEAVPRIEGRVAVCPDVSGSMLQPVTGYRKGATSTVRCIDVAALVTATVLQRNPRAKVLPFERQVRPITLDPRDTILTNAERLAAIGGGGTACSAPLTWLNARREAPDLVILVSDNESWIDAGQGGRGTAVMAEWNRLKARNPGARLVCLDLQPRPTTQAVEREDVLNLGGFSDAVFGLIAEFAAGRAGPDPWVREIAALSL